MCRRIALVLLAALFVFLVATVAAFRYLEWWQAILASAALFGLMLLAGRLAVGWLLSGGLMGFATGMLKMKGRVLHKATIQVHDIRPTTPPVEEKPADDEERDEDFDEDGAEPEPARPLAWFAFDVTIKPDTVSHSKMTMWDIDDLMLVPFDAPDGDDLDALGESDEFGLAEVKVVENGEAFEFEEDKVLGPRRLRFKAGVTPGVTELKFRYYLETFGRLTLPAGRALPPARDGSL